MARRKINMRQIREMFRLHLEEKKSQSFIKRATGISCKTLRRYISYASAASLDYQQIKVMSDDALMTIVMPKNQNQRNKIQPDWNEIHKEMQSSKAATKFQLWDEFIKTHSNGVGYSQFCEYYRNFLKNRDPVLRQHYAYGEKSLLDFCGVTMPIYDPKTLQPSFYAQVFVSVLGASNYTFAYAAPDQSIPNWIDCNVKALEFYGGVPSEIVIDNLKAGVTKASKYGPLLNATYEDFAAHYQTTINPTRAYKPQDKAKVEKGVQSVQRSILFVLRKHKFFSLAELNEAIAKLIEVMNNRKFQKLEGTRKQLFEEFEKPKLKPLPESRYEVVDFKIATVNINYHVEYDGCHYSVPYKFIRKKVEVRATNRVIRILSNNSVIASHQRKFKRGEYITLDEHMPKKHQEYLGWNPERMTGWASTIGPHTAGLVQLMLSQKLHPTQCYRSIIGIISLAKKYGNERAELAAYRVHTTGCARGAYNRIKDILEKGLDKVTEKKDFSVQLGLGLHENIRGPQYYQ
jgi:transposase